MAKSKITPERCEQRKKNCLKGCRAAKAEGTQAGFLLLIALLLTKIFDA